MALLWENYDPYLSQVSTPTTNKALSLGSTLAVTGAATLSSTLAVTGATTLSGAVTQKANVVSGQGATATLTAAQSGSTVLFDRAAGIVYTLPAPAVGMWFKFFVTTTITSNAAKIITDAGTTLLQGSINVATATPTGTVFFGNGSTHISVSMNGTTTGGIIGTTLLAECVSATLWNISGTAQGSGTVATPFATS